MLCLHFVTYFLHLLLIFLRSKSPLTPKYDTDLTGYGSGTLLRTEQYMLFKLPSQGVDIYWSRKRTVTAAAQYHYISILSSFRSPLSIYHSITPPGLTSLSGPDNKKHGYIGTPVYLSSLFPTDKGIKLKDNWSEG